MSNENQIHSAHSRQLSTPPRSRLKSFLLYMAVPVLSVLVAEFVIVWLGEGARWFNNFNQITTHLLCSSPPSRNDQNDLLNTIMTMLSTHHQSLANLLTIAGVIVTVITVLFYLEGQEYKKELDERFNELRIHMVKIATDAEVMNECQQLVDSILLRLWSIDNQQQENEFTAERKVTIAYDHLHLSAKIKCILSKDSEQVIEGLGILKKKIKYSGNKDNDLFQEVERLLRSLYKIGRLSKDDQYNIANSILTLMGKAPLKNEP